MIRNKVLFEAIAQQIEKHPDTYEQHVWGPDIGVYATEQEAARAQQRGEGGECGGAFCIAGHAAALSGAKPQVWRGQRGDFRVDWDAVMFDGEKYDTDEAARELLGLSEFESEVLFSGDWKPITGMTVTGALRAIGRGAKVSSVTLHPDDHDFDPDYGIVLGDLLDRLLMEEQR